MSTMPVNWYPVTNNSEVALQKMWIDRNDRCIVFEVISVFTVTDDALYYFVGRLVLCYLVWSNFDSQWRHVCVLEIILFTIFLYLASHASH